MAKLGVVIIGRNEGDRLVRCIKSILGSSDAIVYVDSGSTDRSVETVRGLGVQTVLLDAAQPFTAARARNAGFGRLLEAHPEVERVQFVDGDCEIAPDWLESAQQHLEAQPNVAVVCGRRRERYPERSLYNWLCDREWDTPVGEATACGGDAMMRVAPLKHVGGYRDSLIAGEEPELCARLRAEGWKVVRLDAEMTVHDAAMTRFGQWWKRVVRAGYAYAAVSRLHGRGPDRMWLREFRSNWFWGLLLPAAILGSAPFVPVFSIVLSAAYGVLGARIYRGRCRRGDPASGARRYAAFCVLAKFPLALGQARYYRDRLLGRQQRLIEYKTADSPAAGLPRVAYLFDRYPHARSHFLRMEIRAAEGYGLEVVRIAIRRTAVDPVDSVDPEEVRQLQVLHKYGLAGLTAACLLTAVTRPVRWLRAVALAWRFGRRSGGLSRSVLHLAEACLLLRWLRREKMEHLHAHFGTAPADVAAFVQVLGGPPFSFAVQGPEEFDRPEALSIGDKMARAAFVVAVGSYGRSQLLRWCRPADWPRVKIVRCGVDAAFQSGGLLPLSAEPRLVCVGPLVKQNGQLLLIAAAARLAAEGLDFQLVLAGDGPMRLPIEAAIAAHGLGQRVRISGALSNDAVRAELAAARLVVLPGFAEGLSVVLLGALALGRPVVATYVADIPELVQDGLNGWLVPAGDGAALAAALAEGLRAGPDRLAAMGRAAAEAVRIAHDARRESGKLVEFFAEAAGRVPFSAPVTATPVGSKGV